MPPGPLRHRMRTRRKHSPPRRRDGARMGNKLSDAARPCDGLPGGASAPDADHLLHELQVHQQELEMQNRELRRTQLELAAARDRYRDLYDHAPVGYLTLDARGRILEANLTAAELLAQPVRSLQQRPLAAFMATPDADCWHLRRKETMTQATPWRIELAFKRPDGEAFNGQLDCLLVARTDQPPNLRVTLTDVTRRRQADADRRAALQVMTAQEAERRRLARELHDDLGQRLSLLKMNLAAEGHPADADIAAMVEALDDAVASVRRMAGELRPLMLDDLGLSAAVEALARRSARQYGLQLTLHLAAPDPPPGDHAALTLYRLLQASLPVLADQAGLSGLVVELREDQGQRALSLQGQLERQAPQPQVSPLPGRWTPLRETAHLMGCSLEVEPTRGGGERITLRMPVRPLEEAAAPF
ncbi:MAG: hypothetical protein C0505_07325 [Leptothrix sp. (in: Bacteria)]|nr:hypothetical protein [Leptothrix sp. (in: b-proteobacteria)]